MMSAVMATLGEEWKEMCCAPDRNGRSKNVIRDILKPHSDAQEGDMSVSSRGDPRVREPSPKVSSRSSPKHGTRPVDKLAVVEDGEPPPPEPVLQRTIGEGEDISLLPAPRTRLSTRSVNGTSPKSALDSGSFDLSPTPASLRKNFPGDSNVPEVLDSFYDRHPAWTEQDSDADSTSSDGSKDTTMQKVRDQLLWDIKKEQRTDISWSKIDLEFSNDEVKQRQTQAASSRERWLKASEAGRRVRHFRTDRLEEPSESPTRLDATPSRKELRDDSFYNEYGLWNAQESDTPHSTAQPTGFQAEAEPDEPDSLTALTYEQVDQEYARVNISGRAKEYRAMMFAEEEDQIRHVKSLGISASPSADIARMKRVSAQEELAQFQANIQTKLQILAKEYQVEDVPHDEDEDESMSESEHDGDSAEMDADTDSQRPQTLWTRIAAPFTKSAHATGRKGSGHNPSHEIRTSTFGGRRSVDRVETKESEERVKSVLSNVARYHKVCLAADKYYVTPGVTDGGDTIQENQRSKLREFHMVLKGNVGEMED